MHLGDRKGTPEVNQYLSGTRQICHAERISGSCLCPVSILYGRGGGMCGIFENPLKRAIWNTPDLHAELMIWGRILSSMDGV